eukprot:CAMPEP_0182515894 /NCGR_PEP_ID=MMETSP1321-20130603/39151_1 /TAXON_ID=91990 /ORGANISM="Bolidomonas sp., Strain RCC1657" /LENGTH=221 /DNA_ID=CAMNT_0024723391 /DNA_START=14 /DNA_END=676 /DNA_ORIENTATION=+
MKWHHYFRVYDRYLLPFREKNIRPTLLEIGVFGGGSIDLWNYYFDGNVDIIGVDIDESVRSYDFGTDNIRILIGDQEDSDFWRQHEPLHMPGGAPGLDVVLDDGGHTMAQQLAAFDALWPSVKPGGVYMVEDTHTSYDQSYGGGYRKEGTFLEKAKGIVDFLHAHYMEEDVPESVRVKARAWRREVEAVSFFDSVVVIEKKVRSGPPVCSKRGGDASRPAG